MYNIVRLRILADWADNERMRDWISILLFVFICSFGSVISGAVIVILETLLSFFDVIVTLLLTGSINGSGELNYSSAVMNDRILQDLIVTIIFTKLIDIPLSIANRERKMKLVLPIVILVCITFNCLLNSNNLFFVLIIAFFLIPLSWIIPIGSGKYFGIIEYLAYFINLHPQVNRKNLKRIFTIQFIMQIAFRIVLPVVLCIHVLSKYNVEIDTLIAIQIYFGILFFAFLNYSEKLVSLAIRRIIIYMIIVFTTVANIKNDSLDIVTIVANIFTILFAMNRVLSAINDIKKDVEDNSCLYAFDHKGTDADWLVKNSIDYGVMKNADTSENLFIRQLIIHYLLNSDSKLDMLNMYEEYYEKNIVFVKQLQFLEIFDKKGITLQSKIEEYAKYFTGIDESCMTLIPARTHYCFLLVLDEQYDKCIELLNDWFSLTYDDAKYLLYYSYMQTGKEQEASMLKKNMESFDDAEEDFLCNIEEYQHMKYDPGTSDNKAAI